jgi:hypothetical protein
MILSQYLNNQFSLMQNADFCFRLDRKSVV